MIVVFGDWRLAPSADEEEEEEFELFHVIQQEDDDDIMTAPVYIYKHTIISIIYILEVCYTRGRGR